MWKAKRSGRNLKVTLFMKNECDEEKCGRDVRGGEECAF